ncbi:MAG: hypothetical protein H0U98_13040 [Alphaproteobacteria bacterium]|nr:hypothetical protein [Alphaproteobacteria bacterium]
MKIYLPALLIPAVMAFTMTMGTLGTANAAVFNLTATNVSFDIPSPLFTSTQIGGFFQISDSVGAGGSFGSSLVQNFAFNMAGYNFTRSDLDPAFPIDINGRISSDGQTIGFLSFGYSLRPDFPNCDFVCAGTLNVAQSSNSNFIAVANGGDDIGLVTFDANFQRTADVPEPVTLSIFAAGLAGLRLSVRKRRKMAKA